jgi:hypothetical protein
VQTGHWTFSRKAVVTLYPRLKAKGFEIEMEMVMLTLDFGLKCVEVPMEFKKNWVKRSFVFFYVSETSAP